MSEPAIPLWKQELLKRKQAKLTHEKLINSVHNQNESKQRSSFDINNTSNVLNHRSVNADKKAHFPSGHQNARSKNYSDVNTKKGATYNRNIILGDIVDSSDTRHTSGYLNTQMSKADSEPSRLDSFEEGSIHRNTGKYNKNFELARPSGGSSIPGMPRNSRGHRKEEKTGIVILEENGKGILKDSLSQDRGVDCEHIRPQDVKKMWQRQATKDEILPKSHVTHSKNPSIITNSAKELSKSQPSSEDLPSRSNTQVSSKPASVPKAYKSPYAKTHWRRQASADNEKPVETNAVPQKLERNELKSPTGKLALSNGGVANHNLHENVEDEHIQSVKSLLGLFGGKAKPNIGRKISDNVLLGHKTEIGKDCRTSEIKTSAGKRPGLFKHHSEPNLFSPTNIEVISDLSPRSKKSPTVEEATEEVVLPSHHVSQGIQERLTRLRRASHSNMEDMDGFIEYENRLNSEPEMVHTKTNHESPQENHKHSPQHKHIVTEESSSNKSENNKPATVQSFVADDSQEDLFVKKNVVDNEKPRLAANVNSNSELSSPVSTASNTIETHHSVVNSVQNKTEEKKSVAQNQEQRFPEQSFNKLLSVFGPRVVKKPATEPGMSDTKEHKSENKYESKQSNYTVENSQSDSGLQNHVVSTEHSTGIKQNQQEVKPVIKNEENVKKGDEKPAKKPRRKGLNVVDPLAVLQLTKDPILLKEKPVAAELGLIKESPSGSKPKVVIIKHEPDKKAKIAQINRAWDLDNAKPSSKPNDVSRKTMPANSVQASPEPAPKNVPVTSIDEIPVSVIDDGIVNKSITDAQQKSNSSSDVVNVGNTTFYNGSLSSESVKPESAENDEEFIPVSSIDDEPDLSPPPEIVFDEMPGNLKSCFFKNAQKRGKLTFFEHVFIHDYQSETAAAADWDFQNGTSFSSYTPAALKRYAGGGKTYNDPGPAPTPPPETPPTPPEETRNDDPLITYNEEDSVDFTESSDSTAGALLF